jgi:hypothetical protein
MRQDPSDYGFDDSHEKSEGSVRCVPLCCSDFADLFCFIIIIVLYCYIIIIIITLLMLYYFPPANRNKLAAVWRELGAADQHHKNVHTDMELDNSLHQLPVDVNDLLGFDSAARVGWAPLLAATPTANETQAEDEVCDSESGNGVDGLNGNQLP